MASYLAWLWQRLRAGIRHHQGSLLAILVGISTLLIGQVWQQPTSSFPFVISALIGSQHKKVATWPWKFFARSLPKWQIKKCIKQPITLDATGQHALMSMLGWACYHLPCTASWHHLIGVILLIVASQYLKHLPAIASGGATLLGAPLLALLAQTTAFGLLMKLEQGNDSTD